MGMIPDYRKMRAAYAWFAGWRSRCETHPCPHACTDKQAQAGRSCHTLCEQVTLEDGTVVVADKLRPLNIKVLLAMGPCFDALCGTLDPSGGLDIQHDFRRIGAGESYHNQIGHPHAGGGDAQKAFMAGQGLDYSVQEAARPSDIVVCYVYATHTANVGTLEPSDFEEYHREVPADPAQRVYLVGTSAVPLADVFGSFKEKKPYEFQCLHGYTRSRAKCTLTPKEGGQSTSAVALQSMIEDGQVQGSELRNIGMYQPIIHLQQALIRGYILDGVLRMNNGVLDLKTYIADPIGTMFCCPMTRLQLHSMSLCMSDMTGVVKDRVVELPLHLLMVLAFTSFQMLLIDPQVFARSATYKDKIRLFVCVLSALTMDFKQCEYFSDLYVKGLQACNEDDFKKQEKPKSAGGDSGHDKWYFERQTGDGATDDYHCVGLGLTEDNRQICTGGTLHNRIVADDCETSASLIFSVCKTLQVLRALFCQKGILSADRPGVTDNPEAVRGIVGEHFPPSLFTAGTEACPCNTGPGGGTYRGYYEGMVLALAHCLSGVEYHLKFAIGSANAAAVGASPELCGHCFCILETYELDPSGGRLQKGLAPQQKGETHGGHTFPNKKEDSSEPEGAYAQPDRQVVEGTNWTQQHAIAHDLDLQDKVYARITLLSAGLLEVTRCPAVPLTEDVGKGLVDMARGVFYQHIFILGNELLFSKGVYGVSKDALCSGKGVYSKKIEYNLAIRHYEEEREKKGEEAPNITAEQVRGHIMRVSREETVPPWDRKHWESVLSTFYRCQNHHCQWAPGDKRYRFSFVHQVKGNDRSGWAMQKIHENVLSILQDGKPPGITAEHWKRINKMSMDKRNLPAVLDVKETNEHVAGLNQYVTLENVFCSMGSVCFTCCVHEEDLSRVEGMIKGWIQCIQDAQTRAFLGE